ncbi:MAG: transcription elongation factor GreA [Anaerolineae bacterium]|nr:transcription elongation factor GreA [Anaerolineae bacterium]
MSDSNRTVYLTPEGWRKLREELDYLCTVRRAEVAQQIQEAKSDGDIMENVGYDEAKNEQAFLEGRILTLESMLRRAVLIEPGSSEYVTLGSRVTVRERGGDDLETYLIVGSAEADPSQGRISNVSPMGRALLERAVGDEVVVSTPAGELYFEIVSIERGEDSVG